VTDVDWRALADELAAVLTPFADTDECPEVGVIVDEGEDEHNAYCRDCQQILAARAALAKYHVLRPTVAEKETVAPTATDVFVALMEGMGATFVDVTPTVSKPEKKRWTGTAAICLRCANGGTCYKDSPRNGRCRDHVSDGTGDVTPTTDDKK
jgi:hypothetical protein